HDELRVNGLLVELYRLFGICTCSVQSVFWFVPSPCCPSCFNKVDARGLHIVVGMSLFEQQDLLERRAGCGDRARRLDSASLQKRCLGPGGDETMKPSHPVLGLESISLIEITSDLKQYRRRITSVLDEILRERELSLCHGNDDRSI